jgi:holo-[acyl-carrier protein] synthase
VNKIPIGWRVGMDIACVDDVAESIGRFGDRYVCRLFTPHEISCCVGTPATTAAGLAARFAAKEATIKVLRPTETRPDWRSIEVRRHKGGWCGLILFGEASRLAREAGLTDLSVSLSHEGNFAAAVVMAGSNESEHLCGNRG